MEHKAFELIHVRYLVVFLGLLLTGGGGRRKGKKNQRKILPLFFPKKSKIFKWEIVILKNYLVHVRDKISIAKHSGKIILSYF